MSRERSGLTEGPGSRPPEAGTAAAAERSEAEHGRAGKPLRDRGRSGKIPHGERRLKIVLATCGTRGDVQPLAVLGAALAARGHEVVLCAPPEGRAVAELAGCPFRPLGRSVEAQLPDVPDPTTRPVAAARWLGRFLREETRAQLDELPGVVRGADLVVGATFVFGLRTVAEAAGARYRFVSFCPQAIPSASHPSLGVAPQRWPGWLNRLSWRVLQAGGNLALRAELDARRRALGLPPAGDLWTHALGGRPIVASDPELAPVPADAAGRCTQTGHLPLERPRALPPEVEAFLAAGSPPVFVGFGSMTSDDPVGAARTVLAAVRGAGRRALLARGWGGLAAPPPAPDCLVVEGDVPHAPLFARVAAVVHHGGAGTTATAARAGAAQLLCPHLSDQFYWAAQLERAGLTPAPVPRVRLTAPLLEAGLVRALGDERLAARRAEVARALLARDGIAATVAALELPTPAPTGPLRSPVPA